jgi:iron uptake system component EfeO
MKHRVVLLTAVCAVGSLSGCASQPSSSGAAVGITATDTSCEVGKTTFDSGPVTFTVTNKGNQTTEVYIYGEDGGAFTKVITEVENIGPGLTRDLSATLGGGTYEIACKPGQTGDGIRQRITVTGAASSSADGAYDREIEIEFTPMGVDGVDGLTATAGERIEFKLKNTSTTKGELEIIDPTGKIVAQTEADANEEAETIVTLGTAGTWTLKIEGDGVPERESTLTVS